MPGLGDAWRPSNGAELLSRVASAARCREGPHGGVGNEVNFFAAILRVVDETIAGDVTPKDSAHRPDDSFSGYGAFEGRAPKVGGVEKDDLLANDGGDTGASRAAKQRGAPAGAIAQFLPYDHRGDAPDP